MALSSILSYASTLSGMRDLIWTYTDTANPSLSYTPVNLPTELLTAIIALACTDDTSGNTVQALLLTSRQLSDIARPFRFHHVAIAGPVRLAAFCDILERAAAAGERPRVHSIFFSDRTPEAASETHGFPSGPPFFHARMQRAQARCRAEGAELLRALRIMLPIVAPSLCAFTFLVYNFLALDAVHCVLMTPFPRLRALALRTTRVPSRVALRGLDMPFLTRVHLSVTKTMYEREAATIAWACWRWGALVHLTVSGSIPGRALESYFLRRDTVPPVSLDEHPYLPRRVRCVVLQRFVSPAKLDADEAGVASPVVLEDGLHRLPSILEPIPQEWNARHQELDSPNLTD